MRMPRRRNPDPAASRPARGGSAIAGRRLAILPPEGVPLSLEIAGLGARLGAQTLDLIVTSVATALLIFAISFTDAVDGETLAALAGLIFLAFGSPYYIAAELLMNGRTPGKAMLGIRVVSLSGRGLTTHDIVVRNLMKEIEVFFPVSFLMVGGESPSWISVLVLAWIAVVVFVPLRGKARQRLGDLAAGTAVVMQPLPVLLPDLASAPRTAAAGRFVFTTAQLDLYGAFELQVLEQLLQVRGPAVGTRDEEARIAGLAQVGTRIRTKIGYPDAVEPPEEEEFLRAFYTAQRGYLEQKKLLGDARIDKHHKDAATSTPVRAPDPA